MKKIDKLLLRSFVGPFAITFFITLFVLVMQFLWKYVDDLVGKGLEWYVILKLLFYASSSFVSLALPLAVLLSSIMTLGALGEHYELTALKASGLSLLRISRSLIAAALFISIGALLFANYILPIANLKFGSLLYDVRQKRPDLVIKPGVFYNGIGGYSIRYGTKSPDGKTLYDVIIYDHTAGKGNNNVTYAQRGSMVTSEDKKYMIFTLYKGKEYHEMSDQGGKNKGRAEDQARVYFETMTKIFDLSSFKFNRTDENSFREDYRMLNFSQLNKAIDTLKIKQNENVRNLTQYFYPYLTFTRLNIDSFVAKHPVKTTGPADTVLLYQALDKEALSTVFQRTLNDMRNVKSFCYVAANEDFVRNDQRMRHEVEYHRKLTLSFACFLLFLIGAPLGAIIRKGGLGLPFVISVVFFVFFYMLTVSFEKFAMEGIVTAWQGMWIPSAILLPIGIYFYYNATRDTALFRMEAWRNTFKVLLFWRKS